LKAYRGAGFSWGMAQEAGKAARWLAGHHLPALDLFATLLSQTTGVSHTQLAPDTTANAWPDSWASPGGVLCPVVAGTFLSDLASMLVPKTTTVRFSAVASPLILLSFIAAVRLPAMLTISDVCICMHHNVNGDEAGNGSDAPNRDVYSHVSREEICIEIPEHKVSEVLVERQDAFVVFGESTPSMQLMQRTYVAGAMRGSGSLESITLLEQLAHQTYVPSNQASREGGAGAGLNDND